MHAYVTWLCSMQVLHVPQLTAQTYWQRPLETLCSLLEPSHMLKEAVLSVYPIQYPTAYEPNLDQNFCVLEKLILQSATKEWFKERDIDQLSHLNRLRSLRVDDYAPVQSSILGAFTVLKRCACPRSLLIIHFSHIVWLDFIHDS